MRVRSFSKLLFIFLIFNFLLSGTVYPNDDEVCIKTFDKNDSLEEIREKILINGYGFSVDHNWVFDMSIEEKERFFTRRKPSTIKKTPYGKGMGPLEKIVGKKKLPAKFDWRNYNGHSYIGNIRNQGSCGACYSFGASAAAEGTYNFTTGNYDENCADFSESFIIWCLGDLPEYMYHFSGCDGADYDYMELSALVKYGIINETDFPYTEGDPGECSSWEKPRVKFKAWYRIPCGDIEAIKTAIMTYGVVDAAVNTTSAFEAYSSGVYDDTNDTCDEIPCYYEASDHAIALVGWDDDDQAFILRNSWGNYWGENGYMKIKYNAAGVSCAVSYLVMGPSISLSLTGEKKEVYYWAFTLSYADIIISIKNPADINVNRFVLRRKVGTGRFIDLKTFHTSDLINGKYYYTDKYFTQNLKYSYKTVAIDDNGEEIAVSNEKSF
jgi:C1A family cysteine protease